jgi:mannosyl-oligosaccharide alpha-1,3-glucosidase
MHSANTHSCSVAVKREGFKTCDQSGFCKRNRAYADTATAQASTWQSPYTLDAKSIAFKNGQLTGVVLKSLPKTGENVRLPLTVNFLESGLARVIIDEEKRQKGEIELRHGSKARKERYNESEKWAIVGSQELSKGATVSKDSEVGWTKIVYGPESKYEAVIRHSPLTIDFKRDGETHIQFNERGLLNVEHWRPKVEKEPPKEGEEKAAEEEQKIVDPAEDESTWWEESFGGNTDSKPRGPESVALDVSFPGYEHVYGVPEHTGPLSLKQTRGGAGNHDDPYRLYNSDVFEYEMDSPMTLYGAIPLMQAHRKGSTVGVLWLNAAETWIDIVKSKLSANPLSLGITGTTITQTHWFSEAGVLDAFVFLGPTPQALSKVYGELTGYTQLPQQFAIAYHQCRWNYVTDEDVKDVDRKFDKHKIPYDVIWLDIEYTEEKKYFTWDPMTFPDPIGMQKQLDEHERKLVAIIDPHIKNTADYFVKDELVSKDFAIKNKDGNIWDGWCWPGSSYWVDCFNPAAIEWWKGLFTYERFKGSARNLFVWNDMNEPSVFNGPETTSPKDNMHYGDWEHRDLHNINGLTFVNATYQATVQRSKTEAPMRPFILTRSFYVGSQRMGAMWTGDNQAQWSHLKASLPMILNNGISGFPFAGADVGGFFGNPEKDLLVRWYQAGTFYPFFRAHAHIDTRRREPYLAGSPYREIITKMLRLRYALLPAWYTAFHTAHTVKGKGAHKVEAPLDTLPLFMRAGHIFPRRDRPRRSSGLMRYDPFTLVVVLGSSGTAEGTLYLDDGESFDYEQGAFIHRKFVYDAATHSLRSEDLAPAAKGRKAAAYEMSMQGVRVERVIIVGAPASWRGAEDVDVQEEGGKKSGGARKADFVFHEQQGKRAAWAVVRDPKVDIASGWKIAFPGESQKEL